MGVSPGQNIYKYFKLNALIYWLCSYYRTIKIKELPHI